MDTPGKPVTKISVFNARTGKTEEVAPVNKTDAEWKSQLTPEQFSVARKQGTEYAFTGKYHASKQAGPVFMPRFHGLISVLTPIPLVGWHAQKCFVHVAGRISGTFSMTVHPQPANAIA